jgi:hypothetical protein
VSSTENSQAERRRSVRISPKGTVVLSAGDHTEHGRVVNISSGGLLAITDERPTAALLGAAVDVELRLDVASSEWLRLTGHVLRIDGRSIALALAPASEPFMRLMEESSSASSKHLRVRTVVLIDATPERRGLIAEAFRAVGCDVLEISTPLEAIVRLGESQFEPDLIAIADSVPSASSDDLRIFVEREHPRAKLVIIGDDVLPPRGTHWLSSAQDDLIARIRDLFSP